LVTVEGGNEKNNAFLSVPEMRILRKGKARPFGSGWGTILADRDGGFGRGWERQPVRNPSTPVPFVAPFR
jgi:hypothetical protein